MSRRRTVGFPSEWEPWGDPAIILGSSGPVRVSTDPDADPGYEPPRIRGFATEQQRVREAVTAPMAKAARVTAKLREVEDRLCRRLCCNVAGAHLREHPRCSASPLLWDGDQA